MSMHEQIQTLAQALAYFETIGMPARNLAPRTRREYHHDLQDLLVYLQRSGTILVESVTLQDLEGYLADLDRRGLQGSTRNRKTHTIKGFFRYLHTHAIIPDNVAGRLAPRVNKPEPRYLSEAEYRGLLRVCSHHPRDAAIVEVFLQTGMRLSELAHLTLSDVELPRRITRDPDNMGLVRLQRKGGKRASVPLNYKACQALATCLKQRPRVNHDGLFVTKFRTPMSARAIEYMLTKYLAEAGITNVSVHTLRHTMATHHVARGTDLKTVQEMLGHASLATTALYVSLAKQAQKKALQENAL